MQKILIKEFQAITEMEIELSNMLVLIGEQASGKSTIGKLIYFFKSLPQDLIDFIYDNLEMDAADLQSQFWIKIRQKFYNYFGSTRHLPDFEIKYYYDQGKFISLSLYPDRGLKIHITPDNFFQRIFFGDEIRRFIQDVRQFSSQTNAYERSAFQRAMTNLETYIKTLFNEYRIPLFIPAGRNITVSYPDQFKLDFYGSLRSDLASQESNQSKIPWVDLHLMRSFLQQTERIRQRFKSNDFQGLVEEKQLLGMPVDSNTLNIVQTKIEKILRGQYRQDQYGEKIFYDDDNYVYLNNASSGQQEVIRIVQDIFLILLDKEKAFRVIEEPEAHLYPLAQKYLIELLAIVLNQTDSQIIITTHSPYILSVINNLLFAKRVVTENQIVSGEVGAVIPPISWIEPATTNVYALKDGRCKSIFDDSTGLIDQNYLDEISEDLGADFQELYHIHARSLA